MRAHFFKNAGISCVYFPDTFQYFEINDTTEKILQDILQDKDANEICNLYRITETEYLNLVNMLPSKDLTNLELINESESNTLRRLVLHLSNDCNLNCKYCYANGGSYLSKPSLMTSNILRQTLNLFFAKFRVLSIQLFGGEPFLNPDAIEEVCSFVESLEAEKRPALYVVTNGTIISDKILELINRFNINVTVSIDGPAVINDLLRVDKAGGTTTELVEKNIQSITNKTGRTVSIEATYTNLHQKHNIGIDDLTQYLFSSFQTLTPHIVPVVSEGLAPVNYDDLIQSISKALTNYNSGQPLPTIITKVILALKHKKKTSLLCDAGIGTLAVSADGFVYPCFMFADNERFTLGHVSDPLMFESDNYHLLHNNLKSYNKFNTEPCKNCYANTICSGCLGKNFLETGDIFIPHEDNCRLNKAVIEHVIAGLIHIYRK